MRIEITKDLFANTKVIPKVEVTSFLHQMIKLFLII
jgi:hypothetical protein